MELGRSHVRVRGRRSFGSTARRERLAVAVRSGVRPGEPVRTARGTGRRAGPCGCSGVRTRPKTRKPSRARARPDNARARGAGRGVTPHPNNGAERRCSGDDPTTALAPCSGCSSRSAPTRRRGVFGWLVVNDDERRATARAPLFGWRRAGERRRDGSRDGRLFGCAVRAGAALAVALPASAGQRSGGCCLRAGDGEMARRAH